MPPAVLVNRKTGDGFAAKPTQNNRECAIEIPWLGV
jgi:hypothetical protein